MPPARCNYYYYEIRIKEYLPQGWAVWFDGMRLTHEINGETLLTGCLPDQAALHGVLNQICSLGLTLISLNRSEFHSNSVTS